MRAQDLKLLLVLSSLLGACADSAEDCALTLTCPLPGCEQCVFGGHEGWEAPLLVWVGDGPAPECPIDASNDFWDGVAPPAAPPCGTCTCDPPRGACPLPSADVSASPCLPGSGMALPLPTPWDGSCIAESIPGGVGSLTAATILPSSETACTVVMASVIPGAPTSPSVVRECAGAPAGQCRNQAEVCLPSKPITSGTWTYCIRRDATDDPDTLTCPGTTSSPYQHKYTFAAAYTDTRTCSLCTCGDPMGGACSSLLTIYSDGACLQEVASVTARSSGTMCVDTTVLGSVTASDPRYQPGACLPSGGLAGPSPVAEMPMTFCCLD